MDIDVVYDRARRVAVISAHGTVKSDGILAAVSKIAALDPPDTMRGVIWDFRFADLSEYTFQEMQKVWTTQSGLGISQDLRIATVVTDTNRSLIVRLWETAALHYGPMERRVFGNLEGARHWVSHEEVDDEAILAKR